MSPSKSKKRSDANSTAKLPDPTFFIDRSLGCIQVPEAFRQAGIKFIAHEALFSSDARDEEWLSHAGEKGWIVLTKDDKIRFRPLERMALRAAGVAAFILSARNIKAAEMASILIQAVPKMKKLLSKTKRPFIARVTRSGDVSIIDSS